MSDNAAELLQDLNGLRAAITRDLGEMLRHLEQARQAFGGMIARQGNIASLPTQQTYVAEYLDEHGQSRVAVVRTVQRKADGSFTFFTTQGVAVGVRPAQIEGWQPVLQRDNEPLPEGWWRQKTETA